MSGQMESSWYTKYRPRTMEEYSGAKIKDIVAKRFRYRENMPHVIMVHGSRGCGKTTFARVISKYYLCENLTENGPCEECEACQSINDILIGGESSQVECPGVTELDATIMNGKEAIQDVLDDALQSPIYTSFKVLIVDECHMISTAGQNSMLKIIEDIPQHLVVIFATTNPEKVLQTIKSRCQLTLEVRKQSVSDMSSRLEVIAKKEGLKISPQALDIISRKGNRVPRECINILETVAKTYDRDISVDNLKDYLGGTSSEMYIEYFECANKSLEEVLKFINKLHEQDIKINEFVDGLIQFVMDSMYIKHGISWDEFTPDYVKTVKRLFDLYTSSDFDTLLQIVEHLSGNLASENQSKNEMLLTLTAMRISKIKLLANGLNNEVAQSIAENKISLVEHSKMLRSANSEITEKLKIELDMENINDTFDDVSVVSNTASILEDIKLPELNPIEKKSSSETANISLGEEVDSFFDD